MKHKLSLLLMLLAVSGLSVMEVSAQGVKSHIGLSIEGGISHLFLGKNLSPNGYTTPRLGYGGGAALFYELEYNHFIFRTGFGVDYTINNSQLTPHDYAVQIAEYPTMQYRYSFLSFSEKTHYGVGYVPVLFGANFSRVFFLVGAKIGVLPFYSKTQCAANVRIWAIDEDVIDPMEGLYTHYMGEHQLSNAMNLKLNQLNIMGSFEVGINLDGDGLSGQPLGKGAYYYGTSDKNKSSRGSMHYRLSIFADYGLSNMLPAKRPELDMVQFNGLTDITLQSMYYYAPHKGAVMHNCLVGIKFTMQYEMPKIDKSSCHCLKK